MKPKNQNGETALIAVVVVLIVALIASLGFGFWAFSERQDYKDNSDKKAAVAIVKAEAAQKRVLDAVYAKKAKSPYRTYKGPVTYGSISFSYPRTWSGYVDESGSQQPINGYFYPGIVPSVTQNDSTPTAFALRVELLSRDYASVISELESQTSQGQTTASAYIPPSMKGKPNVQPGTRFDGALREGLKGSMIVIRVRDKTLKIYTESTEFLSDFNSPVLRSLTFAP